MKKLILAIVAVILVLAGTVSTAFAAESDLDNVKSTLDFIEQNKANGALTDQKLMELANQINNLERAISASGQGPSSEVVAVILRAEGVAKSVKSTNAAKAQSAISVAKTVLGITGSGTSNAGAVTTEVTITLDNANAGTVTFPDIEGHWAKPTIEKLASEGVITGIKQADGSYKFAPNDKVTVGQFLTLVVRSVVPEDKIKEDPVDPKNEKHWAKAFYDTAVREGIINRNEIKRENLDVVISREDMAYILVGTGKYKGEVWVIKQGTQAGIPDFNTVSVKRQDDVAKAYSEGYLKGDNSGAFKPQNGLTRAESATVINNINTGGAPATPSGPQTFKEGANHAMPKVGDTVTTKDGRTVVLQIGPSGVLGEGQGVDLYSGVKDDRGVALTANDTGGKYNGDSKYLGSTYLVDKNTGEGHFWVDWASIRQKSNPGKLTGSEKAGDTKNTWWEFDGSQWIWLGPANQ